jgi:CheY-like chemotaxis protein/anti-sigma regulatory factor (Ser/Thr protein kinase)
MSHELRTPLNAVLGYGQILSRSQTLSAEDRGHLNTISRSGEHLLALINDVLELLKIDANRVELQPVRFDLHQLLADLEAMFRLRAERKRLALHVEYSSDVPPVILADQGKLRQVLINLLGNAVKYTEKGEVELQVTKVEEGTLKSKILHLKFKISDTGIGIVPGDLEKIFDAFVRVDEQQYNTGTGLGLPISRKYIRMMGGDIRVESEVEKGSVFTFEIPVETVTQSAHTTHQTSGTKRVIGIEQAQQSAEGELIGDAPYCILIVDDDEDNCSLLLHLLEPVGFQVREAHNGAEALEMWKTWQPHLIWMDMRMPVMDGYEVTQRIRAAEAASLKSQIPIIALTASAFEEDREKVIEAGCDDFVRKPFRQIEIFDMLHKYLGVRFLYDAGNPYDARNPSRQGKTLMFEKALTPETLAALPSKYLATLEHGARETNTTLLFEVIEQIRQHNAEFAEVLARLADNFEYDEILAVIQQTKKSF